MADLTVTFCKIAKPGLASAPVPYGRGARTTAIAIGVSSAATTDLAAEGEFAHLKANADCWVSVGSEPTAVKLTSGGTATGSQFPMSSGETLDLACVAGDKIAVITN